MAGEAAGGERPAGHPASGELAPEPPTSGDPRVDAALARLDELPGVPVTEHPRVFDDVHRRLEDVLDELDADRGSAGEDRGAAPGPGR